jgi:hypothetical protein
MKKLNKYRIWFWLVGIIGALVISRFFNSNTLSNINIVIPHFVEISLEIFSIVGMAFLVVLGFLLGRKLCRDS